MAQFYTKERSVGNATAKIYDDSQRILQQSEQLIESMRAVSSYEERQQATLIDNLRAHRQKEKEENTRNHQLLMDNMKQVFEVQDQNNVNDLQRRKEKIEQEERTLETIADLSVTAAKTVGKIREGVVEEIRQKALEDYNTGLLTTPEQYDADILAHDAQENSIKEVQRANAVLAKVAEAEGKPRNWWSKLLVNDSQREKIRLEVAVAEEGNMLVRGGLQDIIRNDPKGQVSVTDPITNQPRVITHNQIALGQLESSELLNRAYSEIARKHLRRLTGDAHPIIFNKAYSKVRQYINGRTLQYSDKLDRDKIREHFDQKGQLALLADTPQEQAEEFVKLIQDYHISPEFDAGVGRNIVINELLPLAENPVAIAAAIGELGFTHMGGKPLKGTLFHKQISERAAQLQTAKDQKIVSDADAWGKSFALEVTKGAVSDNDVFDIGERTQAFNELEEKEGLGTISWEQRRAAEKYLDLNYQDFKETKLEKVRLEEYAAEGNLTQEMIDQAFANGHIRRSTWQKYNEQIRSLSEVKLDNGSAYSRDNVNSLYYTSTSNKLGQFDISGRAKHFSAKLTADIAADMWSKRFKALLNDPKTNYTAAQAAEQAFNDIQAKIDNEEGVFFVDRTDSQRGNIYSKVTPGGHTGAPRQIPVPSIGATQVGLALRGDGIAKLNDTDFPGLTTNYPVHRERIKAGLPLKPTAFEQAVADASGYSFTTLVNKMLEANGEEARAEGGTYDVFADQVPKENAELRRVLDSPKTWNKLSSVIDRTDNVMPARMGAQGLSFCNAHSIASKLKNPNPEVIAALWYSKTGGGSNVGSGSPMQQIQQIIEDNPNYNMSIDYSEVANLNPELIPIMQQYGDSHVPISGMSKTMCRVHSGLHNKPVDRGGLFNLIGGGESSMDALVFNTGTTNSTGRFPINSTFASVEKAQSEGSAFAAGSWQGTPGVLNQGRVAAGLADNANFSSLNNQSRAFWGLLLNTNKRPALKAYLLGESNDINAAHLDLANEFAAIEGPSGKGSYDGDSAGNKANTKASQVRAALQQARNDLASNPINFNK